MTARTIKQTAEYLQCSEAKVRDMVRDGRIPAEYVIWISKNDRRIAPVYFDPTPNNVTQYPVSTFTDADVQRFADAVAACLIVRLIGRAA